MKKLIKICEIILFILFLILIPFLKDKLSIFLAIPVIIGIYLFVKNEKIKRFALFIFIFSFLIRLISIIFLKVEIVDDFKTMLDASNSLIHGDLSFSNSFYFIAYPYQLGHVLYQAGLLKIFNDVFFLQLINCIVTSLIVLFIYLISRKIVKEKTARFITLLYSLYFYPIYLTTVLTNQHIPTLLSLIVIYLLITKKDTWKLSIVVAILLGLANFLRTESIIFIMGILIYKLFVDRNKLKTSIINSFVLLGSYLIFTTLISSLVYISPINKKLTNTYPEWKFYCGLSSTHNGIYNTEDQDIFFKENANKKELLINRIKEENIKLPLLFLKKEVILWTQTNYDLRLTNNLNNIFLLFNQGYLNIIIILLVISLIPKKKETNKKVLLLEIILGIYYGIYMFIEISPRYAYILHTLVFILIGVGIERLINKYRTFK